jgi:hypothetical protein
MTSDASGVPGTSARLGKPSPSTWMVNRRRPLSVVTSGTGMSGLTLSAARKNSIGLTAQRSPLSWGRSIFQ